MHFLNKNGTQVWKICHSGIDEIYHSLLCGRLPDQYSCAAGVWFSDAGAVYDFPLRTVWRLVSWVLIPPPTGNIIFYADHGCALLSAWYCAGAHLGAFRFNVYIFGGMIFTVLGALLLYVIYGVNTRYQWGPSFSTYYINMTIFLAFAVCYPDMRIMLWFIIPIKMKWMAGFLCSTDHLQYDYFKLGRQSCYYRIYSEFLIFFFSTRNYRSVSPKEVHRKRTYHRQVQQPKGVTRHKCAICGRTELDDPNLEFRFVPNAMEIMNIVRIICLPHEHVK